MASSKDSLPRGGKAGRVITAALVGALSIGAPMSVLVISVSSGGVDLLVATGSEVFSAGSLTGAKTSAGDEVKLVAGQTPQIVKTPGEKVYLVPTEVTPAGADSTPVDVTGSDDYTVTYWTDAACTSGQIADPATADWNPGTYYMKISAGSGTAYDGGSLIVEFEVVAASLDNATLFDAGDGSAKDTTDATFTYDAAQQHVGVAVGSTVLTSGTDYDLTFKVAGTDTTVEAANLKDAGTYDVYVTGKGAYAGSTKKLTLTVGALDLSKAELSLPDTSANATAGSAKAALVLDGKTVGADLQGKLKVTLKSGASDDGAALGSYAFTVEAADGVTSNVTGSATVSQNRVTNVADDSGTYQFYYDGSQLADAAKKTVDLSKGESIDLADINVVDTGSGNAEAVANADLDISVVDASGKAVSGTTLSAPGVYTVTYRVNAAATKYAFGSAERTLTVTVTNGQVASSDVVVNYKGAVVPSAGVTDTYNGTNLLDNLSAQISFGDKTLVAGTDYRVVVTNEDGEEVSQVVDAGKYTVSFESDTYDLSQAGTVSLTVSPLTLSDSNTKVAFDGTTLSVVDGKVTEVLPYTGKAYEPKLYVALTADGEGNPVWTEVSASDFDLTAYFDEKPFTDATGKTEVDEVSAAGSYAFKVAATDKSSNFSGDATVFASSDGGTKVPFLVTSDKCFTDVPASEWYADAVAVAVDQGYVQGINNGSTFEPLTTLDRAQFVTVLYRMAGGSTAADGKSYDTGFSDVAPNAWYAKALAWAVENGIVTGYPDGTFGGSDPIQTEQMVTMLARYAQLKGDYAAPTDVEGTLAGVEDGGSVSAYARESVAWAVKQGLIGRDGALIDPQGSISRGRTVTIAVRYQPVQASITK